jgi:8-oxo-dGTP diphosphatase
MPTQIAIAVVERAGHYLIGQRPPDVSLGGYWEFPGGKTESGELPQAAAARECLEETGLQVDVSELLNETDYVYDYGAVQLHFFLCTPQDRAAVPRPPFRWVAADELPQYEFPPANARLLELLASRGGNASGRDFERSVPNRVVRADHLESL